MKGLLIKSSQKNNNDALNMFELDNGLLDRVSGGACGCDATVTKTTSEDGQLIEYTIDY
jgi:hypothetical protein